MLLIILKKAGGETPRVLYLTGEVLDNDFVAQIVEKTNSWKLSGKGV